MMIPRYKQRQLEWLIARQAAVGLLGPRQVGKTTLAEQLSSHRPSVYLDLELPSDRAKLKEPELFLDSHLDKLVILDEIHRAPDIFQVLRSLIDRRRRQGQTAGMYLVLGSASLDLMKQSSESLAGRIAYLELNPLCVNEVEKSQKASNKLWLRGGFPNSYLAADEPSSLQWRQSFIQTYLERDIPQLGPRIPAETLQRFWQMLAHSQGNLFNAGRFSASLGVSGQTVGRYLDLLCDLFLVRRLQPWLANVGKRLVKSPKVYVRDSGIVHALLDIMNYDELLGHPIAGTSFEGFVIENISSMAPRGAKTGFYRTSGGAEIDLVVSIPPKHLWAIEIKRSLMPRPEKGFFYGCQDLSPTAKFVVYPGDERFPVADGVEAIGLNELLSELLRLDR